MKTKYLLVLAAIAATAGCSTVTSEPYAQLTGYRWNRVGLNTFDVTIISVDGEHYIERGGVPIIIKPGQHQIVVQGPPTAGFRYGDQRTLDLNVEPCTYYWLEARKQNALQQTFEPAVNYEEPISGCKRG